MVLLVLQRTSLSLLLARHSSTAENPQSLLSFGSSSKRIKLPKVSELLESFFLFLHFHEFPARLIVDIGRGAAEI